MSVHLRITGVLLAAALGGGFACGGAKTPANDPALPVTGSGRLALELVDAPAPQADEIWVNVTEVRAHSTSGGWFTVKSFQDLPDKYLAVDLLKLQAAAMDLGFVDLPTGTTITQIRLLVTLEGNSVVVGGTPHTLEVPSGYQSGIKIKGPWTIEECTETKLTIDFDGKNSIHVHPTGVPEKWILRPVVRVKKEGHTVVGCTVPPPAHEPDRCTVAACPGTETCGADGYCKGDVTTTCTANEECVTGVCDLTSGTCGQAGNGGGCYADGDCQSVNCTEGVCAPSDPGGMCFDSPEDCSGGTCNPDGSCSPPTDHTPGTSCSETNPCAYGACDNGVCGPGGVNTPCTVETQQTDCQTGLTCAEGTCEAISSAS